MKKIDNISIIEVTKDNIDEYGIFCIKDKKSAGYKAKVDWYKKQIDTGLKIHIAYSDNKQLGFIEYLPSEFAWRPVNADNFMFVQCIIIFAKDSREFGLGSLLLQICENDALKNNKYGVCAVSSDGVWIANKSIYEKNDFVVADKLERFELMVKTFTDINKIPKFYDWTLQQKQYSGWNLIYSDQCPWHDKSAKDLKDAASDYGIEMKIQKILSPEEAQNSPSGFGTFSLIYDGKLLADHYISRTRFENILKKELKF
jgi:hypothetical protein